MSLITQYVFIGLLQCAILVGTQRYYWLRGSKPSAGENFCTCLERPLTFSSLIFKKLRDSLPAVKRPGFGVSHPHPTSKCKDKSVPLQVWSGPEGSRKLKFPDFMTKAQECGKIVSLMHRPLLPPGNSPGTHFCYRLSRPQGHSAIGRIMSMKNSNDTIWNRTGDLPICSTAP